MLVRRALVALALLAAPLLLHVEPAGASHDCYIKLYLHIGPEAPGNQTLKVSCPPGTGYWWSWDLPDYSTWPTIPGGDWNDQATQVEVHLPAGAYALVSEHVGGGGSWFPGDGTNYFIAGPTASYYADMRSWPLSTGSGGDWNDDASSVWLLRT